MTKNSFLAEVTFKRMRSKIKIISEKIKSQGHMIKGS